MTSKFLLFPYLRYKCDKTSLMAKSTYKKYYDANIYLITDYPQLRVYDRINDPFSLIRICIILQAIKNKISIEKEVELYKNIDLNNQVTYNAIHKRLPYLDYSSNLKIYVPFFSPTINKAYDKELVSLLELPFSSLKNEHEIATINPFFAYGYKLFDSSFSNLILIKVQDNLSCAAFYSIEMEILFIVSDQGTLLEQINLFDSKNIDKRKDHLFDRLTKLVDFYFNNDKDGFINCLKEEHFISNKTMDYIIQEERKK